ncbi:hypothetical protein TNCT_202921, partial [Trichonephila clavata]
YKVLGVSITSDEDVEAVDRIKKEYRNDVEYWRDFQSDDEVFLLVSKSVFKEVKETLDNNQMKIEIVQNNLDELINAERGPSRHDDKLVFGFNLAKHNSFDKIQKFLRKITSKYESMSKLEVIGNTHEKRPIYAVHV